MWHKHESRAFVFVNPLHSWLAQTRDIDGWNFYFRIVILRINQMPYLPKIILVFWCWFVGDGKGLYNFPKAYRSKYAIEELWRSSKGINYVVDFKTTALKTLNGCRNELQANSYQEISQLSIRPSFTMILFVWGITTSLMNSLGAKSSKICSQVGITSTLKNGSRSYLEFLHCSILLWNNLLWLNSTLKIFCAVCAHDYFTGRFTDIGRLS